MSDWIEFELDKARAAQKDKSVILMHVDRGTFNRALDEWLKRNGTDMGYTTFLLLFGGEMRQRLGYTTSMLIADIWNEDFYQAWKRNGGD